MIIRRGGVIPPVIAIGIINMSVITAGGMTPPLHEIKTIGVLRSLACFNHVKIENME